MTTKQCGLQVSRFGILLSYNSNDILGLLLPSAEGSGQEEQDWLPFEAEGTINCLTLGILGSCTWFDRCKLSNQTLPPRWLRSVLVGSELKVKTTQRIFCNLSWKTR